MLVFYFFCCQHPVSFCRTSQHKTPIRHLHSLGNQCAGSHHTIHTNVCSIQNNCTHTNNRIIRDRATMQNGTVSNGNIFSDFYRVPVSCMYADIILHIAVPPDPDRRRIRPKRRIMPYADTLCHRYIACHDRRICLIPLFFHYQSPFAKDYACASSFAPNNFFKQENATQTPKTIKRRATINCRPSTKKVA